MNGTTGTWLEGIGREVAAILLFGLLAVSQTHLTRDLGTNVYGGGSGDPGQDVFVLHWVTSHILHPSALFEGNTFFPSHYSILYYDPLLLPAVLAWPVWAVGGSPVLAYNASILLVLVSASWGFYRLGLHLFDEDAAAAILCGLFIPFMAQQTAHLWHLNLLTLSGFPFVILAMLKLFEKPNLGWALLLGVAYGLQSATSGYHAFSCLFLCSLLALWHLGKFSQGRTWAYVAVATSVALVILLPYLRGFLYLRAHDAGLVRSAAEQVSYSVDFPRSLLASQSYIWGGFRWAGGSRPAFPGVTVLALSGLGLTHWRSQPLARLLASIAAVFLLLSLGPVMHVSGHPLGPGPFALVEYLLPLFRSVRHPITFAAPGGMALGLLAAAGLHWSRLSRVPAVATAILLCVWAETLGPRPQPSPASQDTPAVYEYLKAQPKGALMELFAPTGADHDPWGSDRAQWWAIWHGMDIAQGSGAFEPARFTDLAQKVKKEWKTTASGTDMDEWNSVALLKSDFPIRYLVLHEGVSKALFQNVEASHSTFEALNFRATGDRVYRIRRGGRSPILSRLFRDDQLLQGRVTTALRRPNGAGPVTVRFNGRPLDHLALTSVWTEVTWNIPRAEIRVGMNELEVSLDGATLESIDDYRTAGLVVEMRDIEAF